MCIYIYTHMYMCICVYMYRCIYVYVCIYIYIYMSIAPSWRQGPGRGFKWVTLEGV